MTPEESLLHEELRAERRYRRMAQEKGLDELIIKMASKQDTNVKRDNAMRADFEDHKETPAHEAHPWTRETFIFVLAGILGVIGLASVTGTLIPGT